MLDVQLAMLHAIGSPSKPLRHTVGTNVAVIVGAGGLATWPELLAAIVQSLESGDANALEGALDALFKVCGRRADTVLVGEGGELAHYSGLVDCEALCMVAVVKQNSSGLTGCEVLCMLDVAKQRGGVQLQALSIAGKRARPLTTRRCSYSLLVVCIDVCRSARTRRFS